jgi:tetratricopeptide (TPR) repeat protein
MRLRILFIVGAILLYTPLSFADWLEANSEHFVIYADDSERDLRTFSEKLERYHKAMTVLFPSSRGAPSPSNRVTIYVVGSDRQVRQLLGDDSPLASSFVQGFYTPRAGGSVAFTPPVNSKRMGEASQSEMVLMHEYAHHFMYENLGFMVPPWFTEGFAEYFANASFKSNGDIVLGNAANSRAHEFSQSDVRQISIEELLDSETYAAKRRSTRYDNFYVRSWSLFHYLYSNAEGKNKLTDYIGRLNNGESELDAARAAFGDLDALDRELKQYLRGRIMAWQIPSSQLEIAPVTIRALNEAEADSIGVRMRSRRGVSPEQAAEVVVDARELAVKYPDESEVQAMLAEAEFDAGNDEAAIAAADRALSLNPNHINALIQKGYALARIAGETQNPNDWAKVRSHFLAVNKIEVDHPIPLLYFFLSYLNQGMEPTQNAVDGLEWALQLAPYDSQLRMITARAQVAQKHYQDAIQTLSVLAFNPHNDDNGAALALLETAKRRLAEEGGASAE